MTAGNVGQKMTQNGQKMAQNDCKQVLWKILMTKNGRNMANSYFLWPF